MDGIRIAIVGGTGELGTGLGRRWHRAGFDILIGSRSVEKADAAASELGGGSAAVIGASMADAARDADIVVVAVPWSTHDATLGVIAPHVDGKILIDAVVPLVPPKVSVVQLPAEGSAAQRAQGLLPGARVVGAFHNVAAKLLKADADIDCDILVCGDDKDARDTVVQLVAAAGMKGIDAGPLANSAASEALTSLLIGLNRRYKVAHAGIRITGLL
jgi:NADPH-dependent F420 reductase